MKVVISHASKDAHWDTQVLIMMIVCTIDLERPRPGSSIVGVIKTSAEKHPLFLR